MRIVRSMWLLALLAIGCSSKPAAEPVWIGQLLSLEGPDRAAGARSRQGAELAVTDGPAIAGRSIAVLHVDERGDAATMQAETVRLITVNNAAALLADFDATRTERLLRANQPYGVPVIVPGELPAGSEAAGVLSMGVPPAVRGRLLAHYAGTDLGLRRVAVLTDGRLPDAIALAAAFVKAWPRGKGGALEEWTFTSVAERDDRLDHLIQAAPGVVLLACSVADFRALRPRLAAKLPQAPLVYGGSDAGASPLQAGLEIRPDVYLATAYSADHLTESGRDFARKYQERFHEPPDLYAAQAYDGTRLLVEALQRVGGPDKDALVKELERLESFDALTGPIHWKDHQPRRRLFLIVLTSQAAKVVRTIEPDETEP
jgi:branched-chain amino acid transport system substrate-binding protein